MQSVWWQMLEKGDCKIPSHREHERFRRRFGVTFERFKFIVDHAKGWAIDEKDPLGKTFGGTLLYTPIHSYTLLYTPTINSYTLLYTRRHHGRCRRET